MPLRAETVFILSSLDKSTLAEYPKELDPCTDEVLREPAITSQITAVVGSAVDTPNALRALNLQTRENVAQEILAIIVPLALESSDPTPIPGIVTPKPDTGLPPVPVPVPGIEIPEVTVPGSHTIEFQELIPGFKPPTIPLLIPGLENLPLLPGWTVRDDAGVAVKEGVRIPTLPKGLPGIPIPAQLPKPELSIPRNALDGNQRQRYQPDYPNYPAADILESTILDETDIGVEPLHSAIDLTDEALEFDMIYDTEDVLVPNGVLIDEELDL